VISTCACRATGGATIRVVFGSSTRTTAVCRGEGPLRVDCGCFRYRSLAWKPPFAVACRTADGRLLPDPARSADSRMAPYASPRLRRRKRSIAPRAEAVAPRLSASIARSKGTVTWLRLAIERPARVGAHSADRCFNALHGAPVEKLLDILTKKQLLKACKLDEAIPPGDPRHYDFDYPDQLRGQAWRERVAQVIQLSGEPTTQIITGLPGSGKSTELKQLKHELVQQSYRVVLADAGAWVRDDEPITHHDILLALVLALYPEGKPSGLTGWAKEYVRQVTALLNTEVVPTELAIDAGVAKTKAALTTDNTVFQRAARRLGEVEGLRQKIFDLLRAAAAEANKEGTSLVIILDGIEKRATGDLSGPEQRERFRNHWFGAFLTHARELRPPVHVVYTVPGFMVRRAAELGAQFGQELQFLPMIRVFRRDETNGRPTLNASGVLAMRAALFKRVDTKYFAESTVASWLVVHSGGYIRDLLRLVIDCIYRTPLGGVITKEIADHAIVQVRQTYLEGIETADESILKQVHEERAFPLTETNKTRMDGLLQGYLMLRYHNSVFWYDAHPLLWLRLGVDGFTFDDVAAQCP
jgi:hypothetical protein